MRRLPSFDLGAEDKATRVENSPEETMALAANVVGETLSLAIKVIFAIFKDNMLRALRSPLASKSLLCIGYCFQ
jgi:hypothetical protein